MIAATLIAVQFTIMMLIFGIVSIATKDSRRSSLFGWLSVSFGGLLALMVIMIVFVK